MFNDHELELLISGLPEIDVDDLRANTEYTGYTPAAKQIQWFWELVSALSKEDLALLVQFVTGTSKVPLEGFKALQVTRTTILSVHLSGPVWILTPSVLEIKLTTFRNLQLVSLCWGDCCFELKSGLDDAMLLASAICVILSCMSSGLCQSHISVSDNCAE